MDLAKWIPRPVVFRIAKILKGCMKWYLHNDLALHAELEAWLQSTKEGAKCPSCKKGYDGQNGNGYQPCVCNQQRVTPNGQK